MSYTYITALKVSKKATTNSVAATNLKNGMKITVRVNRQVGDDDDRVYDTVGTISDLQTGKQYMHFDIEEVSADEAIELTVNDFVTLA
jgi:hypothetical protein